jgi:1-acyl-sn-glycerol-3-phosphate acyltransferase
MDKFLYKTYLLLNAKKGISLLVLIGLFLGLLFLASTIKFEEDISKLIPSNNKTSNIQKVLKTVNFADKIIVHISRKSDGSLNDLTTYASRFVDSVQKTSTQYIKNIQGKVDDDNILKTLDFVHENLPLFLDQKDYKTIHNRIQKDSIEIRTKKNYRTLVSPTGIVAKKTILKDPLGLSFIALQKLKQLNIGNDFSLHDGFLLSKDQKNILLFITPKLASSETSKNAKFVEELYSINSNLNTVFQNKVSSDYFGTTVIAVANAQRIKKDIQLTISIALSILLVILIIFYKKITVPIILFVPTLFGGVLAIAVLSIIRGEISAISLGIGSILLGVTLDYSLHILTHIRDNNSIKKLYTEISKAILMSSLTTACAFLCLLFLKSQALQDLGIFAAISVLGASIFALLFIPLVYKKTVNQGQRNTIIDQFSKYSFHKKNWAIITFSILLILSFFTYNKVSFEKDLTKLNYKSDALKIAEKNIDSLINITEKSMYLIAYANTEEETFLINDELHQQLKELKNKNKIIDFSAIGGFVNSKKKQLEKIKKWQNFWNTDVKNNTQQTLINSGEKLGFKSATFNQFYNLLNKKFTPLETEKYKAIDIFSLNDYLTTKNEFTTIASLIKIDRKNTSIVREIFEDKKQTLLIDRQHINETFLGGLKDDFNSLIRYSFLIVFVLLLIFYRSFSLTLVTSIPIFFTWLITVGIMGLLGLEFNIFNIIISTFIFGLGVDYSIFITNGLLTAYRTGENSLHTHKTSIILSVITTILGVGVLVFAKHPALYSISLVSIIGILTAVFVSFTIQPLIFKLFIGSKTKRPISLRMLIHSVISLIYFGLGGILLSLFSMTVMKVIPLSKKVKMKWFHKVTSIFMKSVLYSTPVFSKRLINDRNENFKKQTVIIANHSSFIDILVIGKLHPKIIFLVNDWVYNSLVFGKIVQLAGFYPVSSGLENGLEHLREKVAQGYSLMVFPEGTRSQTHKINRFHKGAFYLADYFKLDILPVLLHGNSEILSKGTFVAKEGTSTVKVLNRISANDTSFGENYSKKTKNISIYFKTEFDLLRKQIEPLNYLHKIVLEDYRYKGDSLYNNIKKDIEANKEPYAQILNTVGKKEKITHISSGNGQLDFLLSLDQNDRKITSFIKNVVTRQVLKNSYITNNNSKINFIDSINDAFKVTGDILILNDVTLKALLTEIKQIGFQKVILLKESNSLYSDNFIQLGYQPQFKNKNSSILIKEK